MGRAKANRIKSLIVLAVLCASLLPTSCWWGNSGPVYIPEYPVWIYVYLPYVESVDLPDAVMADETFNITVKLSAVLKPEILKAYDLKKPELGVSDWPTETQMLGINLRIYLGDIPVAGNQIDELVFEVPPLPEGGYVLTMESADSREWGGLDLTYNTGSYRLLYPENGEHRSGIEIPFTVLPADDEGGGGAGG
jgi:hypothetical protein